MVIQVVIILLEVLVVVEVLMVMKAVVVVVDIQVVVVEAATLRAIGYPAVAVVPTVLPPRTTTAQPTPATVP